MNDLLAPIYEFFFSWDTHEELLTFVYDNLDYSKMAWVLLLVPPFLLMVFYKFWEPMRNQRLMWFITILTIIVIAYAATTGILYYNNNILEYIGNYTGEEGPDADFFIFQMSLISALIAFILAFFESIIIKKISTNNSHNPF